MNIEAFYLVTMIRAEAVRQQAQKRNKTVAFVLLCGPNLLSPSPT